MNAQVALLPRALLHVTVCTPVGCRAAQHLCDLLSDHFGDAVEFEQKDSNVAAQRLRLWVSPVLPTVLVWSGTDLVASAVGNLPDREVRAIVAGALHHCMQ